MGKRETVKKPKSPRDFYATIDPRAIMPLVPYIAGEVVYEPCVGNGELYDQMKEHCDYIDGSDIHPNSRFSTKDALTLDESYLEGFDLIVTNPPFSRDTLLPLLDRLPSLRPTWLLLPADMMHNKYMSPYMGSCELVLSVGRLCWFPCEVTGKMISGVDNYCWYLFDSSLKDVKTVFIPRQT